MLVLNRKNGERVLIDGGIEVTVLRIRGGNVRLGFAAPRETGIRRAELPAREDDQPPPPGEEQAPAAA